MCPAKPREVSVDSLTAESLAATLEVGELLVVVLDRDAKILFFNRACERLTGYSAEEMLGRPVWELIPPEEHEGADAVHEALHDTGFPSHYENHWLTRGGGRRLIAWSNAALRDESGAITRALGTGIDVTELRSSQREQREAEQRLAGIVHSAMDAIVTVDESQRVVLFNDAAERMFGHEREAVMGQPLEVLIPERFRGQHRDQLRRFGESGQTGRQMGRLGHVFGLRADGEEFPAEAAISRTRQSGQVLLTAIFRDISRRVELERQLRRSEERASLATLIAGLAHDIGTPMNVILGYIGMLGRSLSGERDRERLQIVRSQIERVVNLVQTLLNFARPHEEKARETDVADLLERALDLIPEMTRRRGIVIERDFAEAPPIRAQAERLERAFLNLFVNACDAMAETGGTLRVSIAALPDGVRVRIADSGSGVPAEALPRIFEPFFTTKEAGQGSGLGLFVTRGIVTEQGGEIGVSSEAGVGTEFRIDLPREAPDPVAPAATQD